MKSQMKRSLGLLLASGIVMASGSAQAQELTLGFLTAETGPFVSLSRSNEIAARMAVDEINAAGGVNSRKLRYIAFPKFTWMTFIEMEDELANPETVGFFCPFA